MRCTWHARANVIYLIKIHIYLFIITDFHVRKFVEIHALYFFARLFPLLRFTSAIQVHFHSSSAEQLATNQEKLMIIIQIEAIAQPLIFLLLLLLRNLPNNLYLFRYVHNPIDAGFLFFMRAFFGLNYSIFDYISDAIDFVDRTFII